MKKIFTTIIIVLGVYSASFAQQQKGDVELGINTGLNSSTVFNDGYGNSSYRTGFNFGLAADLYFSNRWSIKGKFIYDQKGWNSGVFIEKNGVATLTNYHLNYLTVPVMANWHFGKTRNWYLNFGPYAGFLTDANETAFNNSLKPFFKSTDFGIALGIGVKIPLSDKVKLNLEYEGQGGISDLGNEYSGSAIRNSRGSLNVGFNFMLK
ncbi:MAG: porin family protein [Mucilaginibacter sp.]|uniref:porin family protein n=1 Tax=Mucilaginibacter sp. TaxID=1882438 RepID=UPI0031B09F4C